MPRKKLIPRKLDRSPLLESDSERTARVDALRKPFLDWFQTVPGAEWEQGSTDGMTLWCRWYVHPEFPDWGKIFCAFRIDAIDEARRVVAGRDPGFLPMGAEWKILDLVSEGVTRETLLVAYGKQQENASDERMRRLGTAAYGRILNELWYREHPPRR